MLGFNQVTLAGNVGSINELRYTDSGTAVFGFSVAINSRYTNSAGERIEKTLWVRCTAWNAAAETLNQYLHKGDAILISGELQPAGAWTTDSGEAKASIEVRVSQFRFLGGNNRNEEEVEEPSEEALPF